LCRQAVDLAPEFLAAHQTLAEILESQGLAIDAFASYRQILYLHQAAGRLDEALAVAYHMRSLEPDDIDNLVVLGELLQASGKLRESLSVLDYALSQDSSNTRALASRGAALIASGRYEDALYSLDQALSLDPTSTWALMVKGDTLRILGRYDEALAALEQALALFGDDPWVLGTKGEVLRAMGRTAEAVTTLRRVTEITPTLAWIQVELSAALRDAGQLEDALLAVNKALDLLPDDLEILMFKVDLLSALERFDKALEVVNDILQREPNFTNALWLRSDVLRQLGRNEEALAALDQLLMLNPTNAVFSGTRGLVLRSMGQQRKAAGALIRAVKLGNCPAWVETELASLLIDLGLPRQALKMLAEVREVEPGNAAAWRYTGEAMRLLNRHDEALTALGKALEIEPDNAYALGTKAQVLKAVGRKDESIEAFRQAIMLMPSWSWLHVELGELAGYDLVLVALDDALKECPRNPWALSAKGEALRLLGRFRDAWAFLDKALEIVPEDPFTLATKGQVLIALKDNDAAGDALLRAVRIEAELGWAYSGLSALDRQQDALEILQQALENDPLNWRLLNIQGQMLSDIGEFERAAESHQRAIDLSPEDAESYSNLGWAFLNLGRGSNALHAYQNAWRYGASLRDDFWIRRGLADALMVAGDVKSGRELFHDLIGEIERSFSNRDAYILSLLGWCHYQLGHVEASHYERALSHYSDALAQALGDILSTQFDLALVLLCMGRGPAACQEYKWALKLTKERSLPRQRGLILVALQDVREAELTRRLVKSPLETAILEEIREQLEDRLRDINNAEPSSKSPEALRSFINGQRIEQSAALSL
jgi:tetratricopeptide (TPR) repeat protein